MKFIKPYTFFVALAAANSLHESWSGSKSWEHPPAGIKGHPMPKWTAVEHTATPSLEPLSSQSLLSQYRLPNDAQGATVFSLIYGIPLHYFNLEFLGAKGLSFLGTNTLGPHIFVTPEIKEVVRPNVDTLYTIAVLDLSQGDVEIYLPPMQTERMYLLAFWDPFGSQFASLGSVPTPDAPGHYLLSPALQSDNYGVHSCEGYQGCLDSPTTYATLLVRVEVKNNSTDLEYANGWISQVDLTQVNNHSTTYPPLTPSLLEDLSNSTAVQTLELLGRLEQANPPWQSNISHAITEILNLAGIQDGEYNMPPSVNITEAYQELQAKVDATKTAPNTYKKENNGWSIANPDLQGVFLNGTDFLERAYFGITGYLGNVADIALYPTPTQNSFSLTTNEAYIIEMSGKPPLGQNGFWSITAYNEAGFLNPNSLNKYSLGDRSNVTYADGTLVYPDYLHATYNSSARDGPFQLLVQGNTTIPPANWTNNWLPVPADGTSFTLTFRVYDPLEQLVDAEYEYPVMTKQAAVLG